MVGANRTALIGPERRFAQLFAEHHGIAPPVPIEELLAQLADVECDTLPGEADGIVLRRAGQRPRVIVSRELADNRRRFTLAHELGHLVLPWQVGTAFCHPRATYVAAGDFSVELEAQANRFAGELLVPRLWLAKQLDPEAIDLADRIVGISEIAQVSPITAAIALGPVYPFQAATCITTEGRPPYCSFSETWRLRRDFEWWNAAEKVGRLGGHISRVLFGPYTLHAVVFGNSALSTSPPIRNSKEVLAEILEDAAQDQRLGFVRVVSGIVGSANNYPEAQHSADALLRVLHQRFLGNDKIRLVTTHPLFDVFLEAKAHELHARKHRSG